MKTRLFLTLLLLPCLLDAATSKCDLEKRAKKSVDFPDITKYSAESYIMGVEYTVSGATQTDYYTEYYDSIFNRGRIDTHIQGENKKYLYESESWEAWTIEDKKRTCNLGNTTDTPYFSREGQNEWFHYSGGENPTTIGPSAMFKNALDAWKTRTDAKGGVKMAYMGESKELVRGEPAVYWRRCVNDYDYVDYFFADEKDENAFDIDVFDKAVTPLRVVFYNISNSLEELSREFYDVISFQHLIPVGVNPFVLPKGRGCRRGFLADGPKLPNFSRDTMLLSAEVVYQKYSTEDDEYSLLSAYYSTLMFAKDDAIKHVAYSYSSWNTTKPDKEHKEPFINAPNYIVFDQFHKYKYNVSYETGKCDISRSKDFDAVYTLPENGGNISLFDPLLLFPDSDKKLDYLTQGKERGMDVDIYETEVPGFPFGEDESKFVKRMVVTHTYLRSNLDMENTVEVKKGLVQIQLRLYRENTFDTIEEVLTFNIFGFTTRLPSNKQYIFGITRCFKNDDDYSYMSIGFEIPTQYLEQMPNKLPQLADQVVSAVTRISELNIVRIPVTETDMKNNYAYVTLLILGKPPLALDFNPPEADKTIKVSNEERDTKPAGDFTTCATECLETRDNCWGFSLCGGTCYFGVETNTQVAVEKNCSLYRTLENYTYVQSKEKQIDQIVRDIEANEFMVMITFDNEQRETLTAADVQVTDPAEDDSLFEKMGNTLNPRMRVFKAGAKLKKEHVIKNMGKLRFDECQRLCLDFQNCETLSYCLINSNCVLSNKYASDLKETDMEVDELCSVVTRYYADNFERTPGVFVKVEGGTEVDAPELEDCAKACLKEGRFQCLSFDHCGGLKKQGCTLYKTHYLNPNARKDVQEQNPSCGHYTRKFSNEFKRKDETRLLGSKVPPLTNLTLEECAKSCIDYGQGTCYGYDFCQDKSLLATVCTLFDSDPSRMESSYSPICTNYVRGGSAYAPRPYTNSYAGGIGFLCFLIGAVIGIIAVFTIAYIRVNRQTS